MSLGIPAPEQGSGDLDPLAVFRAAQDVANLCDPGLRQRSVSENHLVGYPKIRGETAGDYESAQSDSIAGLGLEFYAQAIHVDALLAIEEEAVVPRRIHQGHDALDRYWAGMNP